MSRTKHDARLRRLEAKRRAKEQAAGVCVLIYRPEDGPPPPPPGAKVVVCIPDNGRDYRPATVTR